MHFARHVLLLCQAFGIATTIAAVAASKKCPTPSSFIFTMRAFNKRGRDTKLDATNSFGQGAFIEFRPRHLSHGLNYHLAGYEGTTCVLHDNTNRVAVIPPDSGETPTLFNKTQVPSGSSLVQCALNSTTDVLACHAGSANMNNLVPNSKVFIYGWQLVNTTAYMPFTIKAFPPNAS